VPERELIFPLIPSRRSSSLEIAGRTSKRRGSGSEIASSRPYRRGDTMKLVDWRASARLSTARASDEFVVRDRLADDAVRVLVIVDRSPSMALFPGELPWLHKPDVVLEAGRMILASSSAAHALVGYAEHGARGPMLEPPRRDRGLAGRIEQLLLDPAAPGTGATFGETLRLVSGRALDVPPGTFAFVLSDFLPPPEPAALRRLLATGWDVIPVVVQDPVWEQSFPDVGGVTLPLADPATGRATLVRLRRSEARARREANELRARRLRETWLSLGLDTIVLTSPDRRAIHGAFLAWAAGRQSRARKAL
jgi:uncharacterized protein (DUF58 family)